MEGNSKKEKKSFDRVYIILLVFCFLFTALSIFFTYYIVHLQFLWDRPVNSIEQFIPNYDETIIPPDRGDIMDCNGRILASSTPLYDIRMDCCIQQEYLTDGRKIKIPKNPTTKKDSINEKEWKELAWMMCQQLPSVLKDGKNADDYYNLIISKRENPEATGRKYVLLAKEIDHSTLLQVRQLPLFNLGKNISGKIEEKKSRRLYPYKGLAARVIGDIRIDPNNPGADRHIGIDGQYDYILHGTPGKQWMKSTDNGKVVDMDREFVEVEHGADIRTTLDMTFQDIADKALRKHIADDEGLEGGCAVVMEVKTGAIKAMANLIRDKNGQLTEGLNMAVGRAGAPGSVFKTVTLMTLLEDGKVTLDTRMDCNGARLKQFPELSIDEQLKKYIDKTGNKTITVREGLAISSNNVFRHFALEHYGKNAETIKQFTDRLFEYKLDGSYEFDLKEKAFGTSRLKDKWTIPDLYSTAMGYSIRQTPLSILAFYNAIAGRGKMMKPYLIQSFERGGEVIQEFKPQILNGAICSTETADTLISALKSVATDGTAALRLKGAKCEVAGKTGTAWVYLDKKDNPKPGDGYITIDGRRKYQATFVGFFPADEPKYSVIVTLYTYLTSSNSYGGSNHPTKIFKEISDRIWAFDSEWGERVKEVYNIPYMKEEHIGTRQSVSPVPNLKGKGLKDAIYALENNGYRCTYEGVGHVVKQSLEAGKQGRKGETVHIILE